MVRKESWSGHGEGGTLVTVYIEGYKLSNLYNSTEGDEAICEYVANWVNEAIAAYACNVGTPK